MFSIRHYALFTTMLLTLSFSALAESVDDSPIDNKSTYHISDKIDLISASDVQYPKPRLIVKLVFPRLSNSDDSEPSAENTDSPDAPQAADNTSLTVDAFNQLVTKTVNEEIDSFKQKMADAQAYQKTLDKTKVKNRLTIDYSSAIINLDHDPIISIRFIIQGYATGMAHPFRRYRVVNFDVNNGSEIQLSELFKPDANYLEVLNDYAAKELEKMLHGKSTENTALSAENFSNWNFNLNGLRFTFDEATVAPAIYGTQTILIPYAKIQELINPETTFGQCLKHRRSCMRDHLLTGGFIDEAANTRHGALNPILG